MSTEHNPQEEQESIATTSDASYTNATDNAEYDQAGTDSPSEITLEAELDVLRTEHAALHDQHIRLFAEFDNFRKRSAKERLDLIQFAGENTLKALLPVMDDMDRAVSYNEKAEDIVALKEGFVLIQQKLLHVLASQGLKPMEMAQGEAFDTDRHEAITKAPAPKPELKGKVIDVVEKGYTLHDKVVRYAKVVVGE